MIKIVQDKTKYKWMFTFLALKTGCSGLSRFQICRSFFFPPVAIVLLVKGETLILERLSPEWRAFISTCSLPLNLHNFTWPLSEAVIIDLQLK